MVRVQRFDVFVSWNTHGFIVAVLFIERCIRILASKSIYCTVHKGDFPHNDVGGVLALSFPGLEKV